MSETDFLAEVLQQADCGLLLDVNNVFVNATNHGFDARDWLRRIPLERVVQLHIAGHDAREPVLIDTHGEPIRDEVWELLEFVLERTGPVSVLIERDTNIPPLPVLLEEASRARSLQQTILHGSGSQGGRHAAR
jgi:uncharacterized protein (UPF0276 family)